MKQLRILDLIFLFLIFGRHIRAGREVFRLLLRLPASANSARCSSAGSTPTNLRGEIRRRSVRAAGTGGCGASCRNCCKELTEAGRSLSVVYGCRKERGEFKGELLLCELIVFVLERYGICNLVEGRFPNPKANCGVFGLSGTEFLGGVPTLDRPENS